RSATPKIFTSYNLSHATQHQPLKAVTFPKSSVTFVEIRIGRKNYLHLGSDAGGSSAAVIYTLIGCAKLNGIDPQAYLRHVLERIADHPSNRIDELLPWAVAGELVKATPTTSATADKLAA
ncbi:transposase domain-containing protein, partial [Variovorax sp. RB3P1]|uniref:transposase domain-containing protein n=1 Tax=Variovorax sp. RB3P1 TaxID=3443732 RepID=UPI003F45E52C